MFQLADRFSTPVATMDALPPEEIWEHLAYLILINDPIGKGYMDALRKQDARAAERFRKILEEIRHGRREE